MRIIRKRKPGIRNIKNKASPRNEGFFNIKQYKLKISYEHNCTDFKPRDFKSFNSAERWRAKREIVKEIEDTEALLWREKEVQEYYRMAKKLTVELCHTLRRLNISIYENSDEDYWYYGNGYDDFAEAVIKPPKGWEWYNDTVEKL